MDALTPLHGKKYTIPVDNIYDPTRGRRISYTAQWAGHGLGGDFDFYKFTAEARMYKN